MLPDGISGKGSRGESGGKDVAWRRLAAHDVDATHVLMGVAMAGLLVPRLDPGQDPAVTAHRGLVPSS
jgi:hypothetical protein